MKVIGVTGGIATGKTTVAEMVASHGGALFDADKCVHQLMQQNESLIAEIAAHHPEAVNNGTINRRVLGEEVFADEVKLKALENLLHPYVREAETNFIEQMRAQSCPFVVLDIPLLFETGAEQICDYVVVTQCSDATQRERAMQRPAMTHEKLNGILARQMTQAEREKRANFVINTEGGIEKAAEQIKNMMKELEL